MYSFYLCKDLVYLLTKWFTEINFKAYMNYKNGVGKNISIAKNLVCFCDG